jgi:hypothetical protein
VDFWLRICYQIFFSSQAHRKEVIPAHFWYLKKAKNWGWLLDKQWSLSTLLNKLFHSVLDPNTYGQWSLSTMNFGLPRRTFWGKTQFCTDDMMINGGAECLQTIENTVLFVSKDSSDMYKTMFLGVLYTTQHRFLIGKLSEQNSVFPVATTWWYCFRTFGLYILVQHRGFPKFLTDFWHSVAYCNK